MWRQFLRGFLDQDFLITVVSFALLITSIFLIFGGLPGHPTNLYQPKFKSYLLYASQSSPKSKTKPQTPPAQPQFNVASDIQPPLESWRGPIKPLLPKARHPKLPIILNIPTKEPVIFLTIDDGWVQRPDTLAILTYYGLPFSLFLTNNGIKNNYNYFLQLQEDGMTIEDHTLSHPDMTRLKYHAQKKQICGTADIYEQVFGFRPTLFRPPYGLANDNTLKAAASCHMKAVVMWHAVVQDGKIYYQDNRKHFYPGDIVLMHFTNNFIKDIHAFIKQANKDNLQVARLEDWIR